MIKDGKREGGSTESLKSNDIIVIDEFNDQELCQNEQIVRFRESSSIAMNSSMYSNTVS